MHQRHLTFVALAALLPGFAQAIPDLSSSPAQRTGLSLTVYNDGQALVRDVRRVELGAGTQRIGFREVAASIRPETASVSAAAGSAVELLEENFDFDLLSPEALLHKYIGRKVQVIHTNPATGVESPEEATVLATNQGVVLRYADRIETGIAGRLSFPDVPATLRDRPTLSVLLRAPDAGARELQLTYLANEISWKADYIGTLDAKGERMALNGWVTLTNMSGASYENATLQLIAGTLNRVSNLREQRMVAAPAAKAIRTDQPSEEKVGDQHLYTVARPTTIAENQTKQLALLSARVIPVRREYVLENPTGDWWYRERRGDVQRGLKPAVELKFENRGGELGIPLPAGVIRVYAPDSAGRMQFTGEDGIGHTARNESVSLRLGEAFDITADRVQTDFKVLGDRARQSSYRIEIRNADTRPVTVTVREPLHGDWSIASESQPHRKESAGSATWAVQVPAEGKSVLEYSAIVRW
jgi:hypothetical protein